MIVDGRLRYRTETEMPGWLRVYALRDLPYHGMNEGDQSGRIEHEENLSHDGTAWVADNARVCGNARILDNAFVGGDAVISGDVQVSGRRRCRAVRSSLAPYASPGTPGYMRTGAAGGHAWIGDEAQVFREGCGHPQRSRRGRSYRLRHRRGGWGYGVGGQRTGR